MERVPPVLFLSVGQSTHTSDEFLRWLVKLKINVVQLTMYPLCSVPLHSISCAVFEHKIVSWVLATSSPNRTLSAVPD